MATREARVDAAIDETTRLREMVDNLDKLRVQEHQRLHDQALMGRQFLHEIRNELQTVVGTLEVVRAEGDMPMPHQREISEAISRLENVATLAADLHALVRGLEPV